MALGDFRAVYMPYCLQRQKDGAYVGALPTNFCATNEAGSTRVPPFPAPSSFGATERGVVTSLGTLQGL